MTINKWLLTKKYLEQPLACYAYISTIFQNELRLVTEPKEIISAIKHDMGFGRAGNEIKASRQEVINKLYVLLGKEFPAVVESYGKGVVEEKSAYEKHFNSVSNIQLSEFNELRYWIDLYGIEYNQMGSLDKINPHSRKIVELVFRLIESRNNIIIFGESGSGKTFLCTKLFKEILKEFKNSKSTSNCRIPVFIELSQINNVDLEEGIRNILKIANDIYENDKSKYVIFFDGLNEVGNIEEQQNLIGRIIRFSRTYVNTRIIITTQVLDEFYSQLDNYKYIKIQQLNKMDIIDYLIQFKDKFENREKAEGYFDELAEPIKEIISIPIFLNILVNTYKINNQNNINNPAKIYHEYIQFLCGSRKGMRIELDKEYQKKVIPFIAYHMCYENHKIISLVEFNHYIEEYNKLYLSSINQEDIKRRIEVKYQIIKKDGNGCIEFVHETIKEYFASLHLLNEKANIKNIINEYNNGKINKNMIINIIKYYIGNVASETSIDLIKEIVKKNIYFACELFAWSSITNYDELLVSTIDQKIDEKSINYYQNIDKVVLFYLKALELLDSNMIRNSSDRTNLFDNLGKAYLTKNENEKAIKCLQKTLSILKKEDNDVVLRYASINMTLGVVYAKISKYAFAEKYFKKAISIYNNNNMNQCLDNLKCIVNLGNVYANERKYEIAINYYEQAISMYNKMKIKNNADNAGFYMNLGIAYVGINDYDNAIKIYKKAISIIKKIN